MADVFPMRLRAYDSSGNLVGNINAPLETTWHDVMGDSPSLQVKLSSAAPSHNLLSINRAGFVAAEVRTYFFDDKGQRWVTWSEPRNARFIRAKSTFDRQDITGVYSHDMAGMLSLLTYAKVWDNDLSGDGKRRFENVTAGQIVQQLLAEAQSRGFCPDITIGFSNSFDSNGFPWRSSLTREYEPATDLKTVLLDLYDSGEFDFYFQNGTLNLVVPIQEKDYTRGDTIHYLRDINMPASPESEDYTNIVASVMVKGEGGLRYKQRNNLNYKPYGGREVILDAGGVSDTTNAGLIATKELAENAVIKRDYTREYKYVDEGLTPAMPARDFNTGDWVFVDTIEGKRQRMRVLEFTVSVDNDNVTTAHVTFGSRWQDILRKVNRLQKHMAAGAKTAASGPTKQLVPASAIKFDTSPNNPTGGLKINSDYGVMQFDTGNRNAFRLDPVKGVATFGNNAITTIPSTGNANIDWAKVNPPTVMGNNALTTNTSTGKVNVDWSKVNAPPDRVPTKIVGVDPKYNNSAVTDTAGYWGTGVVISSQDVATPTNKAKLEITNTGMWFTSDYLIGSSGSGATFNVSAYSGLQYSVAGGASKTVSIMLPTTTTSSYGHIVMNASNNNLYRLTSNSRYKLDQKPLEADCILPALLELEPRTWVDKARSEEDPNYDTRSHGYIAEEVEALSEKYNGALDTLLIRAGEGELNGVDYNNLPSTGSLVMIKDLYAKFAEVSQELDNLKARL